MLKGNDNIYATLIPNNNKHKALSQYFSTIVVIRDLNDFRIVAIIIGKLTLSQDKIKEQKTYKYLTYPLEDVVNFLRLFALFQLIMDQNFYVIRFYYPRFGLAYFLVRQT